MIKLLKKHFFLCNIMRNQSTKCILFTPVFGASGTNTEIDAIITQCGDLSLTQAAFKIGHFHKSRNAPIPYHFHITFFVAQLDYLKKTMKHSPHTVAIYYIRVTKA